MSASKPDLIEIKGKSYAIFNTLNTCNISNFEFNKLSLYNKNANSQKTLDIYDSNLPCPEENLSDYYDDDENFDGDGDDGDISQTSKITNRSSSSTATAKDQEKFTSFYKFSEKQTTLPNKQVQHELTIEIPNKFFGFIIGKKGENLRTLQKQTNTIISIPKLSQFELSDPNFNKFTPKPIIIKSKTLENQKVDFSGQPAKNVQKAATRIELTIFKNRKNLDFTHYVAINFWENGQFISKKLEFLDALNSKNSKIDGFNFDGDRPPKVIEKSHQTIAMATITSDEELSAVLKIVQEANLKLASEGRSPMNLAYKGINILSNETLDKAKVLFTKPKDSSEVEWLQDYYKFFIEKFKSNDIPTEDRHDRLLNHITIINNRCDRSLPEKHQLPFLDVREVVEKFKDFDFGNFEIDKFELVSRAEKELKY